MYSTSDFRRGLKFLLDGQPWEIIEFLHVKPGKGAAFVRTKMKSLLSGAVVERNFRSNEKFAVPDLQYRKMQYLYADERFHFMDLDSYEQIQFDRDQLGDALYFLKENLEVDVNFFEGRPISVNVPNHLVLKIKYTEPGIKGDTVTGATKAATLETGLAIQVPLFIKEGDDVKVDTRTHEYIERVS